jgi:hypothetical protein
MLPSNATLGKVPCVNATKWIGYMQAPMEQRTLKNVNNGLNVVHFFNTRVN